MKPDLIQSTYWWIFIAGSPIVSAHKLQKHWVLVSSWYFLKFVRKSWALYSFDSSNQKPEITQAFKRDDINIDCIRSYLLGRLWQQYGNLTTDLKTIVVVSIQDLGISHKDLKLIWVISIRVLDTPSYFDQILRQSRLWSSKTFDHCRSLEKRGTVRTSDILVQKRMVLWREDFSFLFLFEKMGSTSNPISTRSTTTIDTGNVW